MTTRRPSRPRTAARPARLLRTLVVGLTAVLALAGCMKIDYTATLHSDDTVSWTMVMATSDALAQQMGMDPKDLWQSVGADTTSDLPEGTSVEDYAQDGYTGVKMTAENQPLSAASGTDGALTFTREGDEFVVTGNLDLTDTSSELDTTDPSTQAMLDSFQVKFAVTFPGPVSENNGTLDGTTVTWSPKYGESLQVSARGSAIGDGAAPSPSASASESESESPSGSASQEPSASPTEEPKPTVTAEAPEKSSSGIPTWLFVVIGALVAAAVAVAVVLVLRQRGAAQRAAVAGGPGDLPAWQGPGTPVPPAPGYDPAAGYAPPAGDDPTAGYGAPVPPAEGHPTAPIGTLPPPPPVEDQPTAPITPPPPPPPAPPAPPADEPGSTPPPPPPA